MVGPQRTIHAVFRARHPCRIANRSTPTKILPRSTARQRCRAAFIRLLQKYRSADHSEQGGTYLPPAGAVRFAPSATGSSPAFSIGTNESIAASHNMHARCNQCEQGGTCAQQVSCCHFALPPPAKTHFDSVWNPIAPLEMSIRLRYGARNGFKHPPRVPRPDRLDPRPPFGRLTAGGYAGCPRREACT